MSRPISSLLLLLAFVVTPLTGYGAGRPIHLWSQRIGGTSEDSGFAVATDAPGSVFVTGFLDYQILVAKYGSTGAPLWSQQFGFTSDGYSLATDASGNVFVTGFFQGTVNLGGGNLVSAGGQDIFIVKYSPTGTHLWSQRFGSTSDDRGYSVATDASGNVFMTGSFQGTVNLGGGNLVSTGFEDIFVAKYNPTGAPLWSQRFGGTSADYGYSVATDASGNVFVTGVFYGTADFGGGNLVSAGGWDIFLAKYSPTGTHLWSERFGSTSDDRGSSVATDASGDVFMTGYFQGTADFIVGNLVSWGGYDIFVAKYGPTGSWSQRFGGPGFDYGYAVATDASGNVFVTGSFEGTVDFGGGNLVSAGGQDIFVAKYNPMGAPLLSQRFGSTSDDRGYAVATDASGNVFVTGSFLGTVDFGGGNLVSAGGQDIFVAKFGTAPAEPAITSITDIGNDQGRKVKIRFNRSSQDDAGAPVPVTRYVAFRRDDPPPANMSQAGPASVLESGWTQVGSVDAFTNSDYGIDVPTIGDSTIALGKYYSYFFVRAATDVPATYYDSPVDSGYSLDNLAPGIPGGLLYHAGRMMWSESRAKDFDYFSVYGSNTNSFATATLIGRTVMPRMIVETSPYVFYFVTATDFSGNEGKPAKVNTLTGAGGTPTSYVLSITSYPNPFNPGTTVSYAVPSKGVVTVAIYDSRGERVATLVRSETREAGAYWADWNGRDDRGVSVGSGVYFARIEHASGVRTRKMVLLR